jgi:subtilisin family serine protease
MTGRRFALIALVVVAGLAQPTAQSPLRQAPFDRSREFVPAELLVGFRTARAADIDNVYALHGLQETRRLDSRNGPPLRRVRFQLTPAANLAEETQQIIDRLTRHPLVRFAEPNYIVHSSEIPNDPRFNELYGLHNVDGASGRPDSDVDAPEAWDHTTGSSQVIVFVIDTGIDYHHPDLTGNLWTNPAEAAGLPNVDDDGNGYVDDVHGINAINDTGDPADDMGHGTHVAGIIGAEGDNGVGTVGMAWDVRLGACKFLDREGNGTVDAAVQCFQYINALKAAGHNVLVTNNSWGGGGFSQALRDAMAGLDQPTIQPILHACAAGNTHNDNDALPTYPSSYDLPNVVAVAASDREDLYAYFSSYGATSVDLAAPGVDILSTVPASGNSCCSDPSGYKLLSGTSMATPFVSGAAALVWSANPGLSAIDVRSRLLSGVDYIGDLGTNTSMPTVTQGRLNASNALESGSDLVPPAPVSTLTVASAGLASVTLNWSATGDDEYLGISSAYDVRFSTNPINDANWAAAVRAFGEPTPHSSGSLETMTVTGLTAGTQYYFALRARDNVGNESELSNVASDRTATGLTVYSDDASSPGGWIVAGAPSPALWHRTQRRWTSASHAWWYGKETTGTYNTGTANWGTLTTSIDLTGYAEAALSFSEWSQVEGSLPTFDRTRVQASTDGTTWITVFESHGTNGAWAQRFVDLSAYAGRTAQLRFYFDTRDPINNDFEGWYVDDVKVVGLPPDGFFAGFTASATVGFAPLSVQFTDQSSATSQTIVGWAWSFGTGAGSTLQNPSFTYAEPGSYTVALTAFASDGGQASLAKTGFITVKRTARVDSIAYSNTGTRGKDLLVRMKVVNWAGNVIAGATVTANLYRGSALTKSFTVTSNLDGTATYTLKNANSGCYNTVIANLTSTNHEWNGQTPPNSVCR